MAATTALSGFGLQFQRGGTATTDSYTSIAEVLDFSFSGVTVTALPASHMGSPNGFAESIPGMADLGEVTFDVNWNADQATHNTLLTDAETVPQTSRYWKVIWPPSSTPSETWVFFGFVTKFSPKAPVNGKMTASVVIRASGKATRT